MDKINRRIWQVLKEKELNVAEFEKDTKEQIVQKLSVYHEELSYQNEELKRINRDLEKKHLEYERLFMDAPICYLILDEELKIKKYNDAFKSLFKEGYSLVNKSLTDYVCPSSQDALYFVHQQLKRNDVNNETVIGFVDMTINEKIISFKMFCNIVKDNQGSIFRCSLIDITEERNYKEKTEYLSYHDQLTGLYNRRFFEEELSRLDTTCNLPLGIVLADVNGLKLVNDAFGHHQGDRLLIETANVLRKSCRQDDVIARQGGDEFVILLPKTSELEIKDFIHRIEQLTNQIGIEDLVLSVAFGFSVKKNIDEPIDGLIKKAEDQMYNNKLINHTSQRRKVIEGISATLHEKHPGEEEHSKRVSHYALELGKALCLEDNVLVNLQTAGLLHDIGKIAIDYRIIEKNQKLTAEEYFEVKKHSEIGYRILMTSGSFAEIAEMVLSHHEKIDGTGYPRQLHNNQICIEAKILCICDAFDAMISDRPYRQSLSINEAVEELISGSGKQFDSHLVTLFIEKVISHR